MNCIFFPSMSKTANKLWRKGGGHRTEQKNAVLLYSAPFEGFTAKQLGFVAGLALLSSQTVRSTRYGGSVAGDNAGDTKHGSHFSRGVTQVSGAGKRSRTNLVTDGDCYRTKQPSLVFSGLLSPRQPKQ